MNYKTKTRKIKILSVLFLLTACTDTPSSGDIEDEINKEFTECPLIRVATIKKTNGHALQNGNYLINAEFELELEPLPEKYESIKKFFKR